MTLPTPAEVRSMKLNGAISLLINHLMMAEQKHPSGPPTSSTEASRYSCYISCDMIMMPCSYGDRDSYGISIDHKTIKDVWDLSQPFNLFRKRLTDNPCECPYGF